MINAELSECRALAVLRMSASALRCDPRPGLNTDLREQIMALAHRHRRYGVGMIYLKLRQSGRRVDFKRVERLYQRLRLRRPRFSRTLSGPVNAPRTHWQRCGSGRG